MIVIFGIIYRAENIHTSEVYIGATTKSIEERKIDHVQKANSGPGSYFHEAIATYGPESFQWEQIDTASNMDELALKEQNYILKYQSNCIGYNSDSGGGFKKTVHQFGLNGILVESFEGLKEVELSLGFCKKRISEACIQAKIHGGYYWSYDKYKIFIPKKDLKRKGVKQFDLNGNFIKEFFSASEASRSTNISKTCITRCCRGERRQSGNFLWKFC